MAKRKDVLGGECQVPGCEDRAFEHDLPMCREHWYSIDQTDRQWFCGPPYLASERLPELLVRGQFALNAEIMETCRAAGVGCGLREWRFVPVGWESPLPHHAVLRVSKEQWPDEWEAWRRRLADVSEQTWYRDGKPFYTAEVSHSDERPQLVCVCGLQ